MRCRLLKHVSELSFDFILVRNHQVTVRTEAARHIQDNHPRVLRVDGQRKFPLFGFPTTRWTRCGESNVCVGVKEELVLRRQSAEAWQFTVLLPFGLPLHCAAPCRGWLPQHEKRLVGSVTAILASRRPLPNAKRGCGSFSPPGRITPSAKLSALDWLPEQVFASHCSDAVHSVGCPVSAQVCAPLICQSTPCRANDPSVRRGGT